MCGVNLQFNYDGARQLLDAVEDYLKVVPDEESGRKAHEGRGFKKCS